MGLFDFLQSGPVKPRPTANQLTNLGIAIGWDLHKEVDDFLRSHQIDITPRSRFAGWALHSAAVVVASRDQERLGPFFDGFWKSVDSWVRYQLPAAEYEEFRPFVRTAIKLIQESMTNPESPHDAAREIGRIAYKYISVFASVRESYALPFGIYFGGYLASTAEMFSSINRELPAS